MSNGTISAATRQAHRTGYELAIAMLREFEARPADDDLCFESVAENYEGNLLIYRERPQDNLALRFLSRLRELNDRDAEEGFAAILTDALYCRVDVSALEDVVAAGVCHLDTPSDDRPAINP